MSTAIKAIVLTVVITAFAAGVCLATDTLLCKSHSLNGGKYIDCEDAGDIIDRIDDPDEWLVVERADKSVLSFTSASDDDFVKVEAREMGPGTKPVAAGVIRKELARKALSEFYDGMPPKKLGI